MDMDQVGSFLDRPRRYCNIDGLGELGGSVMCLGCALLSWLLLHSPGDSAWHRISFIAFVGLALLIHYGTKAVKARITYPRTGFVEYRSQWNTAAVAAAAGALTAAGLAVASRRQWDISMLVSLGGLAFAASYGYHFARTVRWKLAILGAMAAASFVIASLPAGVLGALGSPQPVTHPDRARLGVTVFLSLLVFGTLLLVSGGISLWLYLRHTQAPAQEEQ